MALYQLATWSVILSLSFMSVGGLVLWAYGGRRSQNSYKISGPEAEATRDFHTRLVRWFFVYGVSLTTLGAALLLWGDTTLF